MEKRDTSLLKCDLILCLRENNTFLYFFILNLEIRTIFIEDVYVQGIYIFSIKYQFNFLKLGVSFFSTKYKAKMGSFNVSYGNFLLKWTNYIIPYCYFLINICEDSPFLFRLLWLSIFCIFYNVLFLLVSLMLLLLFSNYLSTKNASLIIVILFLKLSRGFLRNKFPIKNIEIFLVYLEDFK